MILHANDKKNNVKGISLIVLVITIVVIIILTSAIVLNLSSNNPIANAQEAAYKSDIKNIQEQLQVYASSQYASTTGTYDVRTMTGAISSFIPSITKYDSEMTVVGGMLSYIGSDETKKSQAKSLGAITDVVTVNSLKYNRPDVSSLPDTTTYAVTFDGSNNPVTTALSTAKTDTTWYDYSTKKWANIKTTNNGNEAYWVWIPRYAYKINSPHTTTAQTIDVKFLSGTTNIPADGTVLPSDYIVHPAFNFGCTELPGIWIAKYEASSSTPDAVEGTSYTGGGNTTALQVRVLPNVYSWRNIYTGNMQAVSMNMTSSNGSVGTTTDIDTHQMKNTEWGAVAYLTYSIYGKNAEPWINPYGDTTTWKMKTGYAGTSVNNGQLAEGNASLAAYNTTNGQQASTTGNVYGVYDMSGGAWEYVAGYIDNGNSNLGSYGTSTYFTSNILKPQYSKYYNTYEPSDQEKIGGTYYCTGVNTLWNADNSLANNTTRYDLTNGTYNKMLTSKGDALYEVSNGVSYYGKNSSNNYDWLKNTTDTGGNYATGWNGDYQLYGHGSLPWFLRGGTFYNGSTAGVFASYDGYGGTYVGSGFRPVLVLGASL